MLYYLATVRRNGELKARILQLNRNLRHLDIRYAVL